MFNFCKPRKPLLSTSGKSVSVSIRALGKTLQGTIAGFIPVADAATKTIFVKVKLPALETTVLNMSATVAMPAGKASTMTMIPRTAIVTHQGQNLAYTIKEGKAAPLPVTIVSYVDKAAAIAPGPLKPGMLVVIDGNDRLKPGDSVQIIPGKK